MNPAHTFIPYAFLKSIYIKLPNFKNNRRRGLCNRHDICLSVCLSLCSSPNFCKETYQNILLSVSLSLHNAFVFYAVRAVRKESRLVLANILSMLCLYLRLVFPTALVPEALERNSVLYNFDLQHKLCTFSPLKLLKLFAVSLYIKTISINHFLPPISYLPFHRHKYSRWHAS
jgi:hypothetical protein